MESNIENSLVLGTAQLGMPYGIANTSGQPDQETALHIIKEAWDGGIRQFDSAQAYGVSEAVLGRALAGLGYSSQAKVISKFDPNLDHLDEKSMSNALDESIARLCVPKLFGMLLHREELLSLWPNGLGETLRGFVEARRVRYIGISVYSPDKAIQALNTEGIDIVQIATNILDRRFENAGVFQLADEKRKKVYIRSVFLQGLLLMKPEEIPDKMAFAKPMFEKLDSLCRDSGLTRQEIALGYIKMKMSTSHVVFGAETSDQVKENVRTWRKKIPESVVNRVRTLFADVREDILNPVLWPN
jgi:aryl-alcohol dehydrogenase-like predicted oxidoreductase